MAAPLKDSFGPDVPARIGTAIAAVYPASPTDAFLEDALQGYEALELTPRCRQIARVLRRHLPAAYDEAIDIILASLDHLSEGDVLAGRATFRYAPYISHSTS